MNVTTIISPHIINIGESIIALCQTELFEVIATCVRLILGVKGAYDLYYECCDESLIPHSIKELKQNWKELAIKIVRITGSFSYILSALTTPPALIFWENLGVKILPSQFVTTLLGLSIVFDILSYVIGGPAMVQTCYEVCKNVQVYYYNLFNPSENTKKTPVSNLHNEKYSLDLPLTNFPTPILLIGLTILGKKALI